MTSALHSKQTVAQGIHGIIALEFANATDRAAGTPVANPTGYALSSVDVGKVALQTDAGTYWLLDSVGPPVWTQIGGAPGGVAPDDMLVFAASGVGTTTTTRYLPFGYTPNNAPTNSVAVRASRSGTLSKLRVRHNVTGSGGAIVYTLYRNGVATALTCSALASVVAGSDVVNTVTVAADDLLEIRVTKGASIAASPSDVTATLEFNS